MSVVSISVSSGTTTVRSSTSYDPAYYPSNPQTTPASYLFPSAAYSPALAASGKPYTLNISPANYHLSGVVVDSSGNVQRFILQDGATGDS